MDWMREKLLLVFNKILDFKEIQFKFKKNKKEKIKKEIKSNIVP